jgi:hypothetical protein
MRNLHIAEDLITWFRSFQFYIPKEYFSGGHRGHEIIRSRDPLISSSRSGFLDWLRAKLFLAPSP